MSDAAAIDPQPEPRNNDVRPIVATGSASNWGLYAFLALLLIGGVVLFNALSASREAAQAPSVLQPVDNGQRQIRSPEPLGVPSRFSEARPIAPELSPRAREPAPTRLEPRVVQPTVPRPQFIPPSFEPPAPPPAPPPPPPRVVFESRAPAAATQSSADAGADRQRVQAGRFKNPSYTVPQGTVIPAVLETALDSTRPGGVRALVQRDVSSFDGTRILVPRGSRLYGEYEANLQRGQNRALVQWTRLIRPDGVTIELDSPSSDPLGRAGIKGKVDGKFWQRFGGALLNSVLDIGVGLAVNEATDGLIVALPGSTQNVRVAEPEAIQPTLKVKQGSSVSVFVARDLDFSSVER